jgi:hypothetical protein
MSAPRCVCARHDDGSVTTFLCPVHADTDPCLTMSAVTGRRRTGTIRRGVCTACGHVSATGRDYAPAGAATAGNNRAVHVIRYALADSFVTMCGATTPRRPQTTQEQLPKCGRCFR